MKHLIGILVLLVLCASLNANGQQVIRVPEGSSNPMLIDGIFSTDEWQDAATVRVNEAVTLYLRQFKGHVFIGVKTKTPYASYVDMFLQTGSNEIYNLHASMQIGERLLTGNTWSDREPGWRWGNHVGWIANESKYDSAKDRNLSAEERLFPAEGKEFQLLRSRFAGRQWRLRIEVRGSTQDIVFPADSERMNTARWATVQL